ncbi:MAG: hypothetical protein ABIF85_02700 [Nanoarchaeota archaeon]|nr:hypothetical protein [Nanoarchaeota archaeon]MBU4300168.1 hypothetical protein [Nanoarchaeota archaeon]MBU4452204.1 hypothetical protein [Nanoarchaeota archaeon]MCG2724374.1 hypothetical protein [archaeon]
MPIEGHTDYKKREYCNSIKCPVQLIMNKKTDSLNEYEELRTICKNNCIHTTYEFHHWLIENGYLLVRPDKKQSESN